MNNLEFFESHKHKMKPDVYKKSVELCKLLPNEKPSIGITDKICLFCWDIEVHHF